MTAFASIIAPYSFSSAVELGNKLWQKKILPIGDLEYQGRQLHFTPSYIRGLADAFHRRAYDQVSFQLADSQNSHTNDPERHRGTIVDMKAQPDGLYVVLQPTPRGEAVLRENPFLGVSARIVEQFQRGDGQFFPAAIQHVLGTLDPRIPGLGAWEPVSLSNGGDPALTIDLSNYSFAGEPAPGTNDDTLTDAELADLISAVSEAELEGYADDSGELSDAELEHLMQAAEAGERDSFSEFDAAFTARQQAEAAREDARAAAVVQDTLHPARRDEDRMARIMARAQDGLYDGQQMAFSAESAAVELAMATGAGICGVPDDFGRCSSRYHELGCSHDQATDWLAQEGGPPRSAYDTAFSNFATGLAIDLAPRAVFDDPDDADLPPQFMPQRTVELAHQLAHAWGLDASAPGFPGETTGFTDLLRPPGAPVSIQDELLADMGYELPEQPRPAYPGVSELRQRMGI